MQVQDQRPTVIVTLFSPGRDAGCTVLKPPPVQGDPTASPGNFPHGFMVPELCSPFALELVRDSEGDLAPGRPHEYLHFVNLEERGG